MNEADLTVSDQAESGSASNPARLRNVIALTGSLAAAAIIVVAIGLGSGQRNDGDASDLAATPVETGTMPASLGIGSDLLETRDELVAHVYQELNTLPPETRTVVVENLDTINSALDEIDRALRETPDSGLNRRLLMFMYAHQLTMLTDMSVLIRHSNREIAL